MRVAPARVAALEALARVRERSAFGHEVLAAVLTRRALSREDSGLATRLVYGTLSAEGTLDEALSRFLDRPSRVEPQVRDALRLAAYELLFSRAPQHAVVHQAVEAVRVARPQAAGLANAVLRRLAEAASDFPWGDPSSDMTAFARLHAHPLWLAELLLADLGRDTAAAMMAADNEPAPLYVAVDPFVGTAEEAVMALTADGADPAPCPLPGCLECGVPSAAVNGSAVREGRVLVVDAGAQLPPVVIGPRPGGLVVDVGAGRGTKTILLQAQNAEARPADIVAVDVHGFKARILEERMRALGVPGIRAVEADITSPEDAGMLPGEGTAEAVLVDAPCSGIGTLRRHPEKRWRLSPEDVPRLARVGSEMLAASARLVRVGGLVVYSTCTVTSAENAQVIEGFLGGAQGRGFAVHPLGRAVPAEWGRYVHDAYFQSFPAPGGPDGHFVAALVRVA